MNNLEQYIFKLNWALRDLPENERAEVVAELQKHIEDGLNEDQKESSTIVTKQSLIAELGSPTELARNLHRANWKQSVVDLCLALIPLLLLNPLNFLIYEFFQIYL